MQLLPNPQSIKFQAESYILVDHLLIQIEKPELFRSAQCFQNSFSKTTGLCWEIATGWALDKHQVGLVISVVPNEISKDQGYRLIISANNGIAIKGHDEAGVFYGVATLNQILLKSDRKSLPGLVIEDWPDFLARGVMLDISRDKVPQMDTLLALIDRLAAWKINQVQLYTEHTFAYRKHAEVWGAASPITAEEILILDRYCKERYIELVPNQNSFGHLSHWLDLPKYADLAEVHGDFPVPWGTEHGPFSLAPTNPASLEFLQGLYDELLPNFSSKTINVGCDETFDLGQGKSKQACQEKGIGQVYLDFLLSIYRDITRRGYRTMVWGDIIVKHPDLVPQLPSNIIVLPWGYEANHPFDDECSQFASAGLEFYVCPGTASWCSIGGRTHNALLNLLNAAVNGQKHGASGYLITDWGDRGHWQMMPISYLGFAAGAAYCWSVESNRQVGLEDIEAFEDSLSQFAFDDPSGVMGRLAYEIGDIYRVPGIYIPNSSLLFWSLQWPLDELRLFPQKLADMLTSKQVDGLLVDEGRGTVEDVKPIALQTRIEQTRNAIHQSIQDLEKSSMDRSDADLIIREYKSTARLMNHACLRAEFALGAGPTREELAKDMAEFLDEYEKIWLIRNRPGGLIDSTKRFREIIQEYTR